VSYWLAPAIIFVLVIVVSFVGVRWARSEHLETLRAVPLFSLLSDRELMAVLRSTQAVAFPPGVKVVEEGEAGKGAAYVITEGTAVVTAGGTELASIGPGSYFGEMSVIDGGPRSATVTARTPVSTLEIGAAGLRHLLDREPMITRSIYEELSRRLKAAGKDVDESPGTTVDRARLVELCATLRQTQDADWSRAATHEPRRLRFSKLFARGG
jgi:CRP/FNR family cyclic AMP-dependent transcriptional regulator